VLDSEEMVHPRALPRKDLREPQGALQIPPLRYATVGMTRGEGWLRLHGLRDGEKPQVPPAAIRPSSSSKNLIWTRLFTSFYPQSRRCANDAYLQSWKDISSSTPE